MKKDTDKEQQRNLVANLVSQKEQTNLFNIVPVQIATNQTWQYPTKLKQTNLMAIITKHRATNKPKDDTSHTQCNKKQCNGDSSQTQSNKRT